MTSPAGRGGTALVVEDDPQLARELAAWLRDGNLNIVLVSGVDDAVAVCNQQPVDVAILGEPWDPSAVAALTPSHLAMSNGGPSRRRPAVLVLGRGGEPLEELQAFEAGADDFAPRASDHLLIRARVRALLRRHADAPGALLSVGALEVDTASRAVALAGCPVRLCRREYELLVHLATEPERVFTKEELLRDVWGYRAMGATRTLDSHASRLRRKLTRSREASFIVNVWGVGYRLV